MLGGGVNEPEVDDADIFKRVQECIYEQIAVPVLARVERLLTFRGGGRLAAPAVMDQQDIPRIADIALAQAKACRELFLVAGHAHQDRDWLPVEHDLQRLLEDHGIVYLATFSITDTLETPQQGGPVARTLGPCNGFAWT